MVYHWISTRMRKMREKRKEKLKAFCQPSRASDSVNESNNILVVYSNIGEC